MPKHCHNWGGGVKKRPHIFSQGEKGRGASSKSTKYNVKQIWLNMGSEINRFFLQSGKLKVVNWIFFKLGTCLLNNWS